MDIKIDKVVPVISEAKRFCGYANITLYGELKICGIKIFRKADESYYLDFPKDEEAEKRELTNIRPSKELRKEITDAVLERYFIILGGINNGENTISQGQNH